jgi:hypothetical protein
MSEKNPEEERIRPYRPWTSLDSLGNRTIRFIYIIHSNAPGVNTSKIDKMSILRRFYRRKTPLAGMDFDSHQVE